MVAGFLILSLDAAVLGDKCFRVQLLPSRHVQSRFRENTFFLS